MKCCTDKLLPLEPLCLGGLDFSCGTMQACLGQLLLEAVMLCHHIVQRAVASSIACAERKSSRVKYHYEFLRKLTF